ncbi:MAG: hypothetical protein P8Y71_17895 [Pseudolabrys sp.]
MEYQDCIRPAQAPDSERGAAPLADANINPVTGLATDYLNHFNEAIMLLEMLSSCPDCVEDFLAWRPLSYREHFAHSRFKGRDMAISAYDAAEPAVRQGLIGQAAAVWLKPMVAPAGALIHGEGEGEADAERSPPSAPQAVVDGLMRPGA